VSIATESAALDKEYEVQYWGKYFLIQKSEIPDEPVPLFYSDTLLNCIIKCESGWNYKAKNPNSSAYGLGQFIDSTWTYVQKKWDISLDRYSYDDQLYATRRLLEEEGTTHWQPSQTCWKPCSLIN